MDVTAAPGNELSRMRRREFPSVFPYPRSSGSIINLPNLEFSLIITVSIFGFSISIIYLPSFKRRMYRPFHIEIEFHRRQFAIAQFIFNNNCVSQSNGVQAIIHDGVLAGG